jgi:hypothetical protein
MTLGMIIDRLSNESLIEEMLADLDDLVLLARLRLAADAVGEPLGSFASAVVGQFLQFADDEQWLSLMTAADQAQDPAGACLRRMLADAMRKGGPPHDFAGAFRLTSAAKV